MGKIKEEVQSGSLQHTRVLFFYTKRTLLLFKFFSNKVSDETEYETERERKLARANATTTGGAAISFDAARCVPLLTKCPLWRDRYDKYFFVAWFIEVSTNLFAITSDIGPEKLRESQEINVPTTFVC